MNIDLIKSLLPFVEERTKKWDKDFKIEKIVKDIDDIKSYNNNYELLDLLNELFLNSHDIHKFNYELGDDISVFKSIIKLTDGRYIQFLDHWIHSEDSWIHSEYSSIYDLLNGNELLSQIREVFPVEKTVIVYE